MRRLLAPLLIAIIMVGLTPASAIAADPLVNCRVVVGNQTRVVCTAAGLVVLNTALNLPTAPPITITLPGPVRTVTQTPAPVRVTETVTQNATETVTINKPGETATVKVPGATKTVTVRPKPVAPQPTRLPEQPSVSPTGQPGLDRATLGPSPRKTVEKEETFLSLPEEKVKEVAQGAISVLIVVVLMLLALYAGYYLGYRERGDSEASLLRALRDQTITKKR